MKTKTFRLTYAIAAVAGFAALPAQAVDMYGYFRGGPQLQANNGHSRECYSVGTAGLFSGKYRLGNECDLGGEFGLTQSFKMDGIDARVDYMVESFNGTGNTMVAPTVAIMSAEFKGFDIAPNAVFFAGKTRQRRGDVHIVDTFFTDMSGNGAGFKELPAGPGKLGFAFYRADEGKNQIVTPGATTPFTPDVANPRIAGAKNNLQGASRFNLEYQDIALGGDNKLGFIFTSVSGKDAPDNGGNAAIAVGMKNGNAFSVKWDAKFAGLDNTVWAQTSKGTAGLNGNFGDAAAGSSDAKWRIVETINGQAGRLGGQAMVLFGSSKDAGVKTDVMSLGGRLSYGMTKNFKLVGEAGTTSVKSGGSTGTLTKFTIAPTLSTGPDFWTRPELRLYVTSAKWNTAANLQAGAAGLTGNADGKTTGTSYGAQVEWWF